MVPISPERSEPSPVEVLAMRQSIHQRRSLSHRMALLTFFSVIGLTCTCGFHLRFFRGGCCADIEREKAVLPSDITSLSKCPSQQQQRPRPPGHKAHHAKPLQECQREALISDQETSLTGEDSSSAKPATRLPFPSFHGTCCAAPQPLFQNRSCRHHRRSLTVS